VRLTPIGSVEREKRDMADLLPALKGEAFSCNSKHEIKFY
jgi:hypothetical protein